MLPTHARMNSTGPNAQARAAFLAGLAEDFAALRADPIAWAEELAEREAWNE